MALTKRPNFDLGAVPKWSDPAWDAEAVNIASTDYTPAVTARGFYVGGAGDVVYVSPAGNTVTVKSCSAGLVYPFAFTSIVKTGTTATNLLALA